MPNILIWPKSKIHKITIFTMAIFSIPVTGPFFIFYSHNLILGKRDLGYNKFWFCCLGHISLCGCKSWCQFHRSCQWGFSFRCSRNDLKNIRVVEFAILKSFIDVITLYNSMICLFWTKILLLCSRKYT